MRSLIAIPLLLASMSYAASEGKGQTVKCQRVETLRFTEINPRIQFSTDPEKKDSIEVSLEIDCESKEVMVPSSTPDAIARLDAALPPDYKIAISKGVAISSYRYGDFAASADLDLMRYFTTSWGLGYESPACADVVGLRARDSQCYLSLLKELRKKYQDMINYSPPGVGLEPE